MQRPPPLRDLARYPITTLAGLGAIGVTIAFWNGFDINPLVAGPRIAAEEPWRLIASAFPHLSVPHLVFNLYWLWAFGTLVERTFGSLRFLGIFVLLAAASSAAEAAASSSGVGLSGVGYGLFGMLWALRRRPGFENVIDTRTIELFIAWFFICIVTTYTGVMKVGNVAHGAGAAVGYLLGMGVAATGPRRRALSAAMVVVLAGLGAGVWAAPPWISLRRGESAGAVAHKGYEALKAGRFEEAADLLGKAAHAGSRDATTWYDYGLALHRLERASEAFDAYLQAARLDGRAEFRKAAAEMGAYLASAEINEHDPDEARGILKKAMEVAPENSKLWMWSGAEKWESGDKAGAIEAYEKAVALDAANDQAKKLLEAARAAMK